MNEHPRAPRSALCVETGTPIRLNGAEASVVIIVVIAAVALTLAGTPTLVALEILTGTGIVGTYLARRAPLAPSAL
ncbi:hypothetical protein G6045_28220 [Streptomyces sp. YC504]|uniref:Uncharacterized protein n=1 Tax=Streptomyces mesophilus TaxID=1775132 RepID=A0A6G4XPJ5_9ACTN|nr:hypothetical protein [Streptomyces mesophilus]NGO79509.1 hypothetical protein [Streptomyces mesophilus]